MTDPPSFKSALALAIEARIRDTWEFEAESFLSKNCKLGKYKIRIATVEEQNNALVRAGKYVRAKAKDMSELMNEADLTENAKVAFILAEVCRDAEFNSPVFESGEWMMKHLSADEFAVLLNHYNECQRLSGPIDFDLGTDKLRGLAMLLANHANTDAPNLALMPFTREQLGEICVRFAVVISDLTKELASKEVDATQD